MIILFIIIGCLIGVILGANAPTISYMYADYLAISIIAALDTVLRWNNINTKK